MAKVNNPNMVVYEKVRECPKDALKPIYGGRLKGMTDINPMWRIKMLTETFGVCGFGWYYEITKQWLENGNGNEVKAFVNVNLYVKMNDEWSKPIQGTGGSAFIAAEKSGLYTSDECYKMALTDAISVACKALGFAADVYWSNDRTKYSNGDDDSDSGNGKKTEPPRPTKKPSFAEKCEVCGGEIKGDKNCSAEQVVAKSMKLFGKKMCIKCAQKAKAEAIEIPEELQPEAGERAAKAIRSDVL